MTKNAIIAVLILIILGGVGLFSFTIGATISYVAMGMVIVAFIALLFATRKKPH